MRSPPDLYSQFNLLLLFIKILYCVFYQSRQTKIWTINKINLLSIESIIDIWFVPAHLERGAKVRIWIMTMHYIVNTLGFCFPTF